MCQTPILRTVTASGSSFAVFVAGNYTEGDVFCASWTVMIVTASSFVFLQFCILVVCVLCIYASRRGKDATSDDAASEPPSSAGGRDRFSAASQSGRSGGSSSIYHSNAASSMRFRSPIHSPQPPPPFSIERPKFHENSASTLRSLRTSLRD